MWQMSGGGGGGGGADLWVRSRRELFLVCRRAEPGDLGGRVCPPPPPPPPPPADWLKRGVPGTWREV